MKRQSFLWRWSDKYVPKMNLYGFQLSLCLINVQTLLLDENVLTFLILGKFSFISDSESILSTIWPFIHLEPCLNSSCFYYKCSIERLEKLEKILDYRLALMQYQKDWVSFRCRLVFVIVVECMSCRTTDNKRDEWITVDIYWTKVRRYP